MTKVVPFERDSQYLARRAQINRKAGRMLDALALQRQAAVRSDDLLCHMDLAHLLCQMHCYEQSNRELAHILLDMDGPGECYFGLCCNYMGMGETELAYRAMVHFLARVPQAAHREDVARVFQQLVQQRARKIDEVPVRRGKRAARMEEAARLRKNQGQGELACDMLKRALLLAPLVGKEKFRIRMSLAHTLSGLGQDQWAVFQADQAMKDRANMEMLSRAVEVYMQAGQKEKARKAAARLKKMCTPQDQRPMAFALGALGEGAELCRQGAKALSLTPYDGGLLRLLAANRARMGDMHQARRLWRRALQVDPWDATAKWYLNREDGDISGDEIPWRGCLPPEQQALWRRELARALLLEGGALEQRYLASPELEEICRWALFQGDHQTLLMARRLLERLDLPRARELRSKSGAMPWGIEDQGGKLAVSPDVNHLSIPPSLRKAMRSAIVVVHAQGVHDPRRVVGLTLGILDRWRRTPGDISTLTAALCSVASHGREEEPDIAHEAREYGVGRRRLARYIKLLRRGEEKYIREDDRL